MWLTNAHEIDTYRLLNYSYNIPMIVSEWCSSIPKGAAKDWHSLPGSFFRRNEKLSREYRSVLAMFQIELWPKEQQSQQCSSRNRNAVCSTQ
jgi:hypothetical protein